MIELAAELDDPRLHDALEAVANSDPDPSVRARARSARDRLTPRPADARQ